MKLTLLCLKLQLNPHKPHGPGKSIVSNSFPFFFKVHLLSFESTVLTKYFSKGSIWNQA